MNNRKRIGLYYLWNKSWIGGVFYAQNLLKALNLLDDKDKPYIDVYCLNDDSYEDLKKNTNYPYLDKNIIRLSLFKKIYREFVYRTRGEVAGASVDLFKIQKYDQMLYPCCIGSEANKIVWWKQDFQEKYYPEFFSRRQLMKRDRVVRTVSKRGIPIVFSSYDSQNALRKFYPNCKTKTFVVHFAVDHIDFSDTIIEDVKSKYGIKGDYLLCANQFWKHKNHLFLFKAYHEALQRGFKLQLVCTGRMADFRNPDYIEELKKFIRDNNLTDSIVLCGLVETKELYCLMQNAYAIIQPSLFEGWNTTVEDSKALNKYIFLSDIPVHKEQINKNVCFFNPRDPHDLAHKLVTVKPQTEYVDYSENMRNFGMDFLRVIDYVTSNHEK